MGSSRDTLLSTTVPSDRREEESGNEIERLWRWARDKECEGFEACCVRRSDPSEGGGDVRGLFATDESSFEAGEYILAIPFSATLFLRDSLNNDSAMIDASDLCEVLKGEDIESDVLDGYLFWMKFCLGENEQWKPYLDSLPGLYDSNFDPTPDFWSEEEIRQLQIPQLIRDSACRKRDAQRVLAAHRRRFPRERSSMAMSLEALQWSIWIVRTRAFTSFTLRAAANGGGASEDNESIASVTTTAATTSKEVHPRTFLIPIIDMVNHDCDPNAELEVVDVPGSYDESFFALRAIAPVQPGNPITILYGTGHETSIDLLARYGFFPPDNPADLGLDWDLVRPEWTTTSEQDRRELLLLANNESQSAATHTALRLRLHLKDLQKRHQSTLE
jgi:hypothetical protein